mgnify:CR=1 FL=1
MPYDAASDAEFVFRIEARNRERLHNDFLREFAGQQPDWGPLGYVTFKRTYARRLTAAQRTCREQFGVRHGATSTEEFWEALRRVTEGTFSVLRQQVRQSGQRWDEAEAQEKMRVMFRLMWEGKFLPPGRGLGMMGSEAVEKKGGACLFNCGMVGTANIDLEFAAPFVMLMDYSMLGVGMGFDTQGAGKIRIQTPVYEDVAHVIPDSREGWCGALERLLNAFVGKGSIPSWDFSQIRPEGAPIHTFGGTASGEGPLKELLYGVELILADVQGKVITSTVIVDIQNRIGRCVVAGNVRRSAEIALGSPDDEAFLALKDPSALIALDTEQRAIARGNEEWATLEKQITEARASIQGRSALDPEVLPVERDIRGYVKAQKALLKTLPAWQQLENRVQAHPLRKYRWASNNTVMCGIDQDYTELAKQTVSNGEPGYAWPEVMRNYGRLSDAKNTSDAKAIGTNPCSEQTLWDAELCNLVETFPTRHKSLDEYKLTLKYAYLFAKVVTCIPTHNPTTNAVIARNRRIGLSMAGIWEMYENLGLRQCTRWWGESYAYIKELDEDYSGWMGVGRSIKVTSVKPGGCRPWYALTTTDQGILTLEEMLRDHPEDMQWAEIKTGANAVQGAGQKSRLAKTYVNGKAQVLRVTLSYGLEIESTPNHQWFVTSREDRARKDRYPVVNEWRRTDELQEGDILEVALGTYQKETHAALHRVNSVAIKMRNDAARIAQPSEMNPDIAWLLGYLWGDGAQSPAQFRLRFSDASTVNLDKVARVLREQFGVETESRQRTAPERTDHVVEVGSKMLWHWLIRNGVWKYFGDKIDVIPEVVRTSSREDILAFLAGLLDSDGCASLSASGGKAIWTTADRAFASHVQHVGWTVGLGLGRSLQMLGASFQGEREMYHLTLGTKVDQSAFARLRQHSTKLTRLENDPRFTGWNWDKEDVKSLIVGKVKKIEALGEMDTYDVEVENTHWFYAGAVKSHNTIPLLLGIEGGMKMPISRFYMRTIRIEAASPLARAIADAGYRVEPDLTTPRTVVAYFPCKEEKAKRVARDVTLWEQCALFTALQARWSDNQVSATLTFKPDEADDIEKVLNVYTGKWKSVSFLPLWDHQYPQAPYIPCSEAEYLAAKAAVKPLVLEEDVHDSEDKFCSGGLCELPVT